MRSISGFLGASGRGPAPFWAAASTFPFSDVAGLPVGPDHVDALLDQVGVQLLDLLLGDLDLLEAGGDLLERQEAALLAFGDQRPELLGLGDRSFVGEQYLWLVAHSPRVRRDVATPPVRGPSIRLLASW